MEGHLEIIDALVDGERVDAGALKRALSDAAGRDYFVDAWLLREAVQEELAHEPFPQVAARPLTSRRWPRLALAASVAVILGGVAGYQLALSRASGAPVEAGATPPSPSATSFPAPAATRAIPIEFSTTPPGARGGD